MFSILKYICNLGIYHNCSDFISKYIIPCLGDIEPYAMNENLLAMLVKSFNRPFIFTACIDFCVSWALESEGISHHPIS